jgi:predicted alpha/beta superfamily hydrolase
MIEIRKVTIPELSDEQRNLYVYLPAAARREPQRRFPVLYMFDGHNVFYDSHATYGRSWRLQRFLDHWEKPMIVVGIECSHEGENRLIEYNLIREVGRLDAPGRPILFGTTEEFLRHFGTGSLDELPAISPVKVEDFKAEAEEEARVQLGI